MCHRVLNRGCRVCRKISKVNGHLMPELRQPGSKIEHPTAAQVEYQATWMGTCDKHKDAYSDLMQLCQKAEEAKLTWNGIIPPELYPESWVSLDASLHVNLNLSIAAAVVATADPFSMCAGKATAVPGGH
jgi:hypothetical protein